MRIVGTRGFACLLVAAMLVASPAVAGEKATETPQGKQWPLKYEQGTEAINKGTEMKVTVGKEKIICETQRGVAFSIPVAGVTEVSYDTKSRRRLAESAAVAAASLGVAAVFAALKTKKHFVNVLWQEGGTGKEVVFKVGKGDYASFLAELQRVTGKEWKNLEMESKRVQEELKREKDKKIAVQLDRRVQVVESDLKPGLYQLVLLEREGNKGELYFFAGQQVNTKKIAAVALVEILTQASAVAAAQVTYKEEGGIAKISEIRVATKTLRFL